MNRAQIISSCYDNNPVWIVEYKNELYIVYSTPESCSCRLLFGNTYELKYIKDKELILALQAVIATRMFEMSEEREAFMENRKSEKLNK